MPLILSSFLSLLMLDAGACAANILDPGQQARSAHAWPSSGFRPAPVGQAASCQPLDHDTVVERHCLANRASGPQGGRGTGG